jgi:hypothetical protein
MMYDASPRTTNAEPLFSPTEQRASDTRRHFPHAAQVSSNYISHCYASPVRTLSGQAFNAT